MELMAKRWHLNEATSLADIGCGLAHWARLLFPYLAPDAYLVGIDNEPIWIEGATAKFREEYPDASHDRSFFKQGNAYHLPLHDDTFDAVTCQTLLMHLQRPSDALTEMIRVTKPGGIVICVEPNNMFNTLYMSSLTDDLPVEQLVRRFEFWLRHHRGRLLRGFGNDTIGELLPGLFAAAGLQQIEVYLSDRAAPYFPPYNTEEQQVLLEQEQKWKDDGAGLWDKEAIRANVLAGGATEEFFESCWAELEATFRLERELIGHGRFSTAGGGFNYLVSGRKPLG